MRQAARRFGILGGLSVALLLLAAPPAAYAGETGAGCGYDELFGTTVVGTADACPITIDARMSTTVVSQHVIHKISGGVITTVIVATTSSGTYTTDAIFSPLVRYPGIRIDWTPG